MSLEKRILKEESSLFVGRDYLREDQSLLVTLTLGESCNLDALLFFPSLGRY